MLVVGASEPPLRHDLRQGVAPAVATIAKFRTLGLDLVPGTGLLAAAVPGAFDAWMRLLRDYGRCRSPKSSPRQSPMRRTATDGAAHQRNDRVVLTCFAVMAQARRRSICRTAHRTARTFVRNPDARRDLPPRAVRAGDGTRERQIERARAPGIAASVAEANRPGSAGREGDGFVGTAPWRGC